MTDKEIIREQANIDISNLHIAQEQGIITEFGRGKLEALEGIVDFIDSMQEKPVSEDLEEASKKWLRPQLDKSYAAYGLLRQMELTHFDGYAMLDAIEFGAKWKEEQFKKNLLDVCKKQTEEEAEIERDFIEGIIENEHRLPTFDDAIKYGMRLQKEQIMKDAIDAELDDVCGFLTISVPYHNGIAGDKVKVIIIKSE